jgi:alpha-glucosidase
MLTLYMRLIDIRHARLALCVGTYKAVFCDEHVLAYERSHDGERLVIALNFSDERASAPVPTNRGTILLSTHLDREDEFVDEGCALRAHEAVIIALSDGADDR